MGLAAGFSLHQFSEVFKIRDAEGQPSIPICLCPQIRTSLGWSESFDGITEHGARHVGMVSSEKALQHCLISLADFPEHPPARLVHQVVFITQKPLRQFQSVGEDIFANEGERGEHGNPPTPK